MHFQEHPHPASFYPIGLNEEKSATTSATKEVLSQAELKIFLMKKKKTPQEQLNLNTPLRVLHQIKP